MGSRIEWHGLYGESWQGEIVPEAFSHPAKFSRALIRKIYEFLQGEGLLAAGDHIIDPFGGVALGALEAMRRGMHWHGCELEPRFVELGNQNIGLWNGRYSGWFADWGTAVLHQGDSRRLTAVVGGGDCVVSSPPYADTVEHGDGTGARWDMATHPNNHDKRSSDASYGDTAGQLGKMSAAVSSPPFEASLDRGEMPESFLRISLIIQPS